MTTNKIHEELCVISQVEPKTTDESCKDENWIQEMKEELQDIEKNDTSELFLRPKDKNFIGTKWVFRNKMNEKVELARNKTRLVCKGYSQQEGMDHEERFSLVARIDVVKIFLAYETNNNIKLY